MSKGDGNKDETPIQFSDPPWATRGGRLSSPINQSHWTYGSKEVSPPKLREWIFLLVFGLMLAVVFYLTATESFGLPQWVGLSVGASWILLLMRLYFIQYRRYQNYKKNHPENESREKPKRKQPKRRKDYR